MKTDTSFDHVWLNTVSDTSCRESQNTYIYHNNVANLIHFHIHNHFIVS
jgi:hypothetical protein